MAEESTNKLSLPWWAYVLVAGLVSVALGLVEADVLTEQAATVVQIVAWAVASVFGVTAGVGGAQYLAGRKGTVQK